MIAHDENDVTLQFLAFGRELADINAARPIGGNDQARARFPAALAQAFRADRRIGLNGAGKRSEAQHLPCACPTIIAHPVNIDREWGGRIGANMQQNRLTRADARARAVSFDPGAAIFALRINPRIGEHPVARARTLVFVADEIALGPGKRR